MVGSATSLVTPGYINAHQHLTGDRLIASCIPDAITSNEAIFDWAVPIHSMHSADDDELSATLASVAGLINGVTCTVEAGTVAHAQRVAAAAAATGMRVMLGTWGWDAPDVPFGGSVGEIIDRQRAVVEQFPVGSGLVEGWVSLVGHDLVSDELFVAAAELAREHGTRLTFHMSPHAGDPAAFAAAGRQRPLVHLHGLGVLGDNALIAHAVHLDDAEIDALIDSGAAVAACPWAYLRLAQGVTTAGRYADLWRRDARLAVGCDAENAGDAVDVLRSAALLAGLCRDGASDPFLFTADDALAVATCRGAAAIGAAARLGSLTIGRQADIVVHEREAVQFSPLASDPVRQLIWSSDGRSVSDVFVAGRRVVADRVCTTVDLVAVRQAAAERGRWMLAQLRR